MRRALLVLLILAAAGAAAWYFLLRLPPGAPPALAAQVSAEHTLMFSSVEKPDVLLDAAFKSVQAQPALAEHVFSATQVTTMVGFDPSTGAGWQSAGLDPATGMALVLDARAGDVPYALMKIVDEPKFLQWVSARVGSTATMADGQLRAGNQPPLTVARRGAFTLITQRVPLAILQTIAQDTGPRLTEAPGFDAAFSETTRKGRLTAFAPLKGLKTMGPFAAGASAETIDFFAGLFPALGGQLDAETMRIRVTTTEKGLGALKQLYAPRRAAPKFSKWLPSEGFALIRLSVNLHECFDGMQALLPPSVPTQMRTQLGFAKMGLAMVGLDWSLLTQAFTGHMAVAVKAPKGSNPQFLALFALGTPESADKIITSLQAKVPKILGSLPGGPKTPVEEITVGGAPGKRIKVGAATLVIVRSGAMLIVASSTELAGEAITRAGGGPGLTGRAAEMMDGDVMLAVHARLADFMPAASDSPMHALIKAAPPIEATISLDRHGAVLEARTMGLLVAGLSAGKVAVIDSQQTARDQAQRINEMNKKVDAEMKRLKDQGEQP